jgi:putative nucleotidyltransferase with HDIG domain
MRAERRIDSMRIEAGAAPSVAELRKARRDFQRCAAAPNLRSLTGSLRCATRVGGASCGLVSASSSSFRVHAVGASPGRDGAPGELLATSTRACLGVDDPRAEPMSDRGVPRAVRYLPHVIVATAAVAAMPIMVVWTLRDRGVVSSPWVAVPLAVVLSLLAALIGSAIWRRHRSAGDLMFSELLLWGWLRGLYIDHKVERAVRRLSLARPGGRPRDGEVTLRQRTRLLSQLAAALEAQDPYLEGHSRRVARHATMIARKIRLTGDEVTRIRAAGVLHDVGKLHVPQGILDKRGRLTTAEFDEVKRHAGEGAEMVACLDDEELTGIVRHHHERLDGSGYPAGLRGEQIPLGARIVAVADTYDAITAARPYRPAASHKQAFETLRDESLTHLDPVLVRAFGSCYSGRRPLAFWESLAASLQAAFLLPGRRGGIERRLSLRDVVASTGTMAAVAVAAIAAPVGVGHGEHRPAPPPGPAPLAAAPIGARHDFPPARRHHPALQRVSGSSGTVVRHRTLSGGLKLGRQAPTRPSSAHRGVALGAAQAPTNSASGGSTTPSSRPPSTAPNRPPLTTAPGTTGSSAPTTTAGRPPVTPPSTPGTTTTTVGSAPTAAPTPTPTSSADTPAVNKNECKKGGYPQYDFSNQGQCIASVERQR